MKMGEIRSERTLEEIHNKWEIRNVCNKNEN